MKDGMRIIGLLTLCGVLVACDAFRDDKPQPDAGAAMSPLQESALAGDREAQFRLGNTYCCGTSGGLDTNEAIRWWCLAAIQKHPGAIAALKKHDPRKTCPI